MLQQEGTFTGETAYWYGVDQYLYYTINNCWKAGARFEWFRDEDGTRVGLNRASNPNNPPYAGDFYSLSLGLNWKPRTNFICDRKFVPTGMTATPSVCRLTTGRTPAS